MKKKSLIYITETSIPSMSANIINSLKFCDALANDFKVNFFLPKCDVSEKKIKHDFSLKNEIFFTEIIKKNISNSFLRFYFSICVILKTLFRFRKSEIIIGRSIVCSIMLALFNKKNILEIHNDLNGLTKILFKFITNSFFKKNFIFIVLNKKLVEDLNIQHLKYIILDDAADIKKNNKKSVIKYHNACVYTGSFFKGKGLEIILKLSKIMPNIEFHLYGDTSTFKDFKTKKTLAKNIKLKGHVKYFKIKDILSKYHIALMPYEKKIFARSSNLEIAKYISPLKMFDYFSAGNIILASKIRAFDHILKHNVNSFTLSNKDINSWRHLIYKILGNTSKFKYIKNNAIQIAKKYSWENRSKKLLNFLSIN